jgi:hypothetical protein
MFITVGPMKKLGAGEREREKGGHVLPGFLPLTALALNKPSSSSSVHPSPVLEMNSKQHDHHHQYYSVD